MPFCWIFSVETTPEPPSNIRPEGEDQLECPNLIMIVIINTELTSTVGNICSNGSQVVGLIFIGKITSPLAG